LHCHRQNRFFENKSKASQHPIRGIGSLSYIRPYNLPGAIRNIELKKAEFADEAKKHTPTLTDYCKSKVPSERIASHFEVGTAALITGMTNIVSLHLDNLAVVYRELGIEKVRPRPWTRRSVAIGGRLGRRALPDESR
jgi:hypothetical protein